MPAPILVTGGTGTLGRLVVPRLHGAGREVRVLSRHPQPETDGITHVAADLDTGEGADAALEGIDLVVHLAGSAKGDGEKAEHLVRVSRGVRHLVYISVIGADRIPMASGIDRAMFGYFGSKRDAERVVEGSGIPFTTLRAAQFHELNLRAIEALAKMPVMPVPAGFRFQTVDADEVAARLVELALGAPCGLVDDMGGPTAYTMAELARSYLRAEGRRRPVLQLRVPGKAAAAIRAGANLAPEHAVGRRTWEEFLADRSRQPTGR